MPIIRIRSTFLPYVMRMMYILVSLEPLSTIHQWKWFCTLILIWLGFLVIECDPQLNDAKELLRELNRSNGLFKFVRTMREKFQAAVTHGMPCISFLMLCYPLSLIYLYQTHIQLIWNHRVLAASKLLEYCLAKNLHNKCKSLWYHFRIQTLVAPENGFLFESLVEIRKWFC